MPRASYIQTNFTSGHLSPKLHARVDINRYANGVKTIENFVVTPHGAAERRGGAQYINSGKTNTKKVRLVPFEFSVEQAYILEFGDLYIRIYRNKGIIEDGSPSVPVEVVTTYTEAELFELNFTQSADVLFIVHKDHEQATLSRTSHVDWALADFPLTDGPYLTQNTTATTLTPAATTGSGIDITASSTTGINNGSGFATGTDVGRLIRILQGSTWGVARITSVTSTTVVVVDIETDFLDTTSVNTWRLGIWGPSNWPAVTAFYEQRLVFGGSPNNPQTLAFSKSDDYPDHSPGVEDSDPMVYTIATDQVNAIQWLSPATVLVVGTTGGEFVVSASTQNEALTPTNVRVARQTTYGSHSIAPERVGNVVLFLQRAQRKIREFVYKFESDTYVAPDLTLLAEDLTVSGVKEIAYQQEPNSILWSITNDGILLGMTYQRDQQVIAWHKQLVAGVSDASSNSAIVESIAVIPGSGSDGAGIDEVWISTLRWVNGAEARHIEIITPGLNDDEGQELAFFVDAGLSLDLPSTISGATAADPVVLTVTGHPFSNGDSIDIRGIIGMTELNNRRFIVANKAVNTFELTDEDGTGHTAYISGGTAREAVTGVSGLDHLEGEIVQVLGNGAVQPDKTVSSGAITLDTAASIIHAGLGYTSKIVTLPVESGSMDGTARGKTKRVHEVIFSFFRTLGAKFGVEGGDLDTIPFRDSSDLMGSPPALVTGEVIYPMPGGYDVKGNIEIRQDQPLPMTILAITSHLKTNN